MISVIVEWQTELWNWLIKLFSMENIFWEKEERLSEESISGGHEGVYK